ncbi:MAG TPA: hypothetical protein VJV03_10025 [Pyrinomonadaceae bacterium]|nr:hypothetical protein [Pyrinomonadaceae bacterium]
MKFKPLRNGSPKTSSKSRRRLAIVAILSGLVLAVAVGVMGVSPKSSTAQGKKYKATKEIVRDQATGALRKPTESETDAMVAQISQLTNRSTDGLTQTPGASGGVVMDLEGRFQGVVLGRAKPDGTTEIRCVFTVEEAADFLGLEQE